MDSLDKFIKENINKTQYDIPDSFNKKIDEVIAELPERNESSILKTNSKIKVIAATLTLCILGTIAINTPLVKAAVSNIVSYFTEKKDSSFIGDKTVVEKFNKSVGVSVKDKDIKVTLDNIVADDNFLMCYLTIQNDVPIEFNEQDNTDKLLKEFFLIPFLKIKINDKEIGYLNNNNQEAYLLNDKTLKLVTRESISNNKIPTKFNLEIYTDEIFKTKGNWVLKTSFDKNDIAKETKTVHPNLKASLDFDSFKRDIKINKISLSPLGNQITIDSSSPLGNFALIDSNGNFLDVLNTDSRDGANSYEFLKVSNDMDFIDIIPISTSNESGLNTEVFTNIPEGKIILQSNNKGKVIVENINFSNDKIVIKYKYEGITQHLGDFSFADKNGNPIDFGDRTVLYSVDRSTNTYTTTYLLCKSHTDYLKVAKIGTWLPKDITLMNNSNVRISLK